MYLVVAAGSTRAIYTDHPTDRQEAEACSQSAETSLTSSTSAAPDPIAALSNAVVRTVMILILSFGLLLIFRMALPA